MATQEELLAQLGSPYTNKVVERLHRFAFVPENLIEKLAQEALSEHWGRNNFVLRKYLAVHVPWAIEQGRFTRASSSSTSPLAICKLGTALLCSWSFSGPTSLAARLGGWWPPALRFLRPSCQRRQGFLRHLT
jgi:hypothetical protein